MDHDNLLLQSMPLIQQVKDLTIVCSFLTIALLVRFVLEKITKPSIVMITWTSHIKEDTPSQLAVMAIHIHVRQEDGKPCFLDGGANNHVTSALENLPK